MLAQRNESSQTAASGSQQQCDLLHFQYRSKSTVFNSNKNNENSLARGEQLSDIDGLLSSDSEKDSVSLSTKIKIEAKQLDLDLLSEDHSVSTAVDPECSQHTS